MFMTTDIADTDANTVSEASQFTPRYPVFDVDTFQSPPPNPPQKKRRRRRRRPADPGQQKQPQEKQPVESPVQIWERAWALMANRDYYILSRQYLFLFRFASVPTKMLIYINSYTYTMVNKQTRI